MTLVAVAVVVAAFVVAVVVAAFVVAVATAVTMISGISNFVTFSYHCC